MSTLLNYVFKVSAIAPIPAASVGFLKRVLVVAKPNSATVDVIQTCTTQAQIEALTDNNDAIELLNAGMTSIYLLPTNHLDISSLIADNLNDFYTILVSSDFTKEEMLSLSLGAQASKVIGDITYTSVNKGVDENDITIIYTDAMEKADGSATVAVANKAITVDIEDGVTDADTIKAAIDADEDALALLTCAVATGQGAVAQAIFTPAVELENGTGQLNVGQFDGVIGLTTSDKTYAALFAAIEKTCGFYSANGKNMFYAFGKMLSNYLNWKNQQYISMPSDDSIVDLGEAELLFDDKISFVLTDEDYLTRLALFACGKQAIVAPYIVKNLQIDMQSAALQYIAANQPQYTLKEASLLENKEQDVIDSYILKEWIEAGVVEIKLEASNFVASGEINISEPKALWRVFAELNQTL